MRRPGKNCSDIALAIDAVQLCEREAPAVVVIVGSDSDFAPLVMHLRDRGCRVEGVGQEGKVGAESHLAYDDFISLPVGRGRAAKAPARRGRRAGAQPRAGARRRVRRPAAGRAGRRRALAGRDRPGSRRANASSSRSPPRRCARRSCSPGTRRRPRCSRSIRTGSSWRRPGSRTRSATAGLPSPNEKRPRGAAFTKSDPVGPLRFTTAAAVRKKVLLLGRGVAGRRQLAGLAVGFGLRLALGRGSCPRSVAGCVVPALPSPAGAILPDLASALVCALRSARVLSDGGRTAAWCRPCLRRRGPACRPCSPRPSRPCAADGRPARRPRFGRRRSARTRRGPRRRRRGRVWSSLISPESFQMEREGANMQASTMRDAKGETRHDNVSSGDRLTRARAGAHGPATVHFTDSGLRWPLRRALGARSVASA